MISNQWLEGLSNFTGEQFLPRTFLSSYFQLLHLFCRTSNETLFNFRTNFYANQLISINLLREEEFLNQSEALTVRYQTEKINSFRQNIDMIIQIILGNQLISIYESNWYFLTDSKEDSPIYTQSRSYGKIKLCFQIWKEIFILSN